MELFLTILAWIYWTGFGSTFVAGLCVFIPDIKLLMFFGDLMAALFVTVFMAFLWPLVWLFVFWPGNEVDDIERDWKNGNN